jgi:ATP-binding cassette subfamily B protein
MNLLRTLFTFANPDFRRAAVFATVAAIVSVVPLGGIAFMLLRATTAAPERSTLVAVAAIVVLAAALQLPLAAAGSRVLRAALDERAEQLRIEVVEHLRLVPARALAAIDPGHALATMTLGLDQAMAIVNGAFDAIFAGLLKGAGCIAIVAVIDWRIALVSLAFLPVTAWYLRQSRQISSRATPRLVRAQAEGASRFYEYVESVALLRAFGCTAERLRRFTLAVSELNVKAFENTIAPMTFGVVALFFLEFAFAIAMTVGVEIAGLSVGVRYILAFTLALAYFQTLFEALDGLLRLRDASSHLDAIAWLLALSAAPGALTAVPSGDLALDGVSFAYDRGEVLHDISFRFPERAVTAVVGASGAGKSALANVISGVWEPSAGSVRVGGAEIGTLAPQARTQTVGIVFQDTQLFEDTIAHNIGAGRPGASDDEVRAAGRIAGCDAFAARLPDGYDTLVRPDGANLSLGERQRIALGRMLLSPAPIVVLDECTANLDAAAERAVHAAVAALAGRKTIVLITHRLASVRHAAQILVLAGGELVESGTHEQLLARGGEYMRLWSAHERARYWRVAGELRAR